MGFHGYDKEDDFEPIVGRQPTHNNPPLSSPTAYPGATLSFHEVTSVESQLVDVAQRKKPTHRDAHWSACNHCKTEKGRHSSHCWEKQRKSLWQAYAKACVANMLRTGRCTEPLDAENADVPAQETYYSCECGGARKDYQISIFCGNVSFKKI